jgi:hypothetical protein
MVDKRRARCLYDRIYIYVVGRAVEDDMGNIVGSNIKLAYTNLKTAKHETEYFDMDEHIEGNAVWAKYRHEVHIEWRTDPDNEDITYGLQYHDENVTVPSHVENRNGLLVQHAQSTELKRYSDSIKWVIERVEVLHVAGFKEGEELT